MKLHKSIQGNGPLIVLVHGWGFSSLVWTDIAEQLSSRYTVMCIDLPGFGKSEFDSKIDSLKSFSEALLNEITEPAIIMGWSLGGLVAQYLAIHHPDKVRQLMCVTSTPCFIKHKNWPGIAESLLNLFAQELIDNYQKVLQRFLLLQFFGMETDKKLIHELNQQIIQEIPNKAALHFGLDLLLKSDLRPELAQIRCPLHYIFGKLDVIVPASVSEELSKLVPKAKIDIIKGASHAPFISHPSIFLETTGLLT